MSTKHDSFKPSQLTSRFQTTSLNQLRSTSCAHDKSLLVTRVTPDEIRAYYNVCLHRGRKLRTESGRAVIVDVADGRELATAVHAYANGVIDEKLPGTDIVLEPDWALQDPNDYIEVFKNTIPVSFFFNFWWHLKIPK